MEEPVHSTATADTPSRLTRKDRPTWRDLREWLALIKSHGLLKSIQAPVSLDEELSAITVLATQADQNAPALMFENLIGDRHGRKVVTNMLGSSKERYALAVGLDPSMSIREMIAASRHLMKDRVAPISIPKSAAPVNEVILQGNCPSSDNLRQMAV